MSGSTDTRSGAGERSLTYVAAFNEGVRQAMAADDDVFVAGEDVGAFGGVFGAMMEVDLVNDGPVTLILERTARSE